MRRLLLLSVVLLALLWIPQGEALEIRYLGHAAFFLSFDSGLRCVLDPFSPEAGYSVPEGLEAHVLVSSHEHFDHFFADFLRKPVPTLVGTRNEGKEWNLFSDTVQNVHISALPSYHDDRRGALRGKNAILVLEGDNVRLVHLGDIGALPESEVREKLRDIDVLFVPAGGHYTLALDLVVELIRDLAPRVVIPMHYRTETTKGWPIASLEEFLGKVKEWKIVEKGSSLRIFREDLPETTEIWVMQPWKE